MALEVIIPVKDRSEIQLCVRSLLSSSSAINPTGELLRIAQITVCDGGSSEIECIEVLNQLKRQGISILTVPHAGFNKCKLINYGILQAKSEFILISDADITWNPSALNALLSVASTSRTIGYIQDVAESRPEPHALCRDRYTYSIRACGDGRIVEVVADEPHTSKRPGCGLICTRRATLLELGGYKEIFRGWGWEDQDLLIRARLLGMQVHATGSVLHLSHSDAKRNCHHARIAPRQTRNQNIITCLEALANGHLWGDLPVPIVYPPSPTPIRVHWPASLTNLPQ